MLSVITGGLIKRYFDEKRELEFLMLKLKYLTLEFNLILTGIKIWIITSKKNKRNTH